MIRHSISLCSIHNFPICIGLLVLALLFTLTSCSRSDSFKGTTLSSKEPASPVELQNQLGENISLIDHRGKVVILTFLFTNCTNVCPTITSQLRDIYKMLGQSSEQTAFIAISTDPERDSIATAFEYSENWSMTSKWDFLVGDSETLQKIWSAYYINPIRHDSLSEMIHQKETDSKIIPTPALSGADRLGQDILGSYDIIHSSPVYIIDRQGRMRVVFTSPFDSQDIAHDVGVLLKQ